MEYKIIRSNRKTLALEVDINGNITVRAPVGCSRKTIDGFINEKNAWLEKAVKDAETRKANKQKHEISEEEKGRYIKLAKEYIPARTEYWSRIMGLEPSYVKITSAEKRYGSCNQSNGICFSYRLMAYDKSEIDYVIVHELAHIRYKNHGKDFYSLIAKYLPDYKKRENILSHRKD